MIDAPMPEAGERPDARLVEEVRSVFDYMPAQLAGNLAGIGVIAAIFWAVTPATVMLPWLAMFAAMWLSRLWLLQRFRRTASLGVVDWPRWHLWWTVGTLTSGALWGATSWVFYLRGGSVQQIALIVIVYTFCIAVVPLLATRPRVFLLFGALCFVPMAARVATDGSDEGFHLAGILLLIFSLTTLLARNYRQALQRALDLKLQADHLLSQLRVEKSAADAARQEAEVANRAKTQFFSAASHDLRQPLHAMGLFAEALRQKNHDVEVAHLVNSINESVDALESLFSELLDITRIDSGGVEVHPQHFSVSDLYRKLRLHFEPLAFEKGLALRLRGSKHMAYADPLLVERIARNLLSNAIRYTADGSVLVSCRRHGDRLMLQVWDTGPGISESEQKRVFEEFYQVPNGPRTDPQQRKGLGLGLAIVKRLAELIDAPIHLRSQTGKGTVFTLELPLGKRVPQALPVPSGKGPLDITLNGRLIVVVEDEPAVRAGLEALLKGWGASIIGFDSVASCSAWARAASTMIVKPDLLIVDYRLEHGANGVDALTALRARFGKDVPAIVITGSTMSALDLEAQQKDFHLLIKPVVPNKLRAMIAFKLGVKPS
ncbi:MAG: ATP-binding protein [Burkholderiaceae bacterium]|nr:ATP-binding protein [Burkholderiaceae bacterium]